MPPPPIPREKLLDRYFLEHRAKVLDLAALLDRLDRAPGSAPGTSPQAHPKRSEEAADPRLPALRDAIAMLIDGKPDRARRILELWSDPTIQPIEHAPGKGATGVWPGYTDLTPGP